MNVKPVFDPRLFENMPWYALSTSLKGVGSAEDAMDAANFAVENRRLFSFFNPIVESGAALYDSIGTSSDRRSIWLAARLNSLSKIAPEEPIGQYVLLIHTYRAIAPVIACKPLRLSRKCVLCDDLLYPLIKIRLTPGSKIELEKSPNVAIRLFTQHFESVAEKFKAMLGTEMDQTNIRSYFESVFPKVRAWGKGSKYKRQADRDNAIEKCVRLTSESKRHNSDGTLWAAYAAIAEYVDYHETPHNDPKRLQGIWGSPLKSYAMVRAVKVLRSRNS